MFFIFIAFETLLFRDNTILSECHMLTTCIYCVLLGNHNRMANANINRKTTYVHTYLQTYVYKRKKKYIPKKGPTILRCLTEIWQGN